MKGFFVFEKNRFLKLHDGGMAVKRFRWCMALVVLAVGLGVAVPQGDASGQSGLTAEQWKDVKQAKAKTVRELKQPSKVLDVRKVRAEAKKRGLDPNKVLQRQQVGAMSGSVGIYGDILVTLDGTSSGSSAWAGGHAGVVSDVSGYVVESFGNKGDLNGVRHWPNDWATRYYHVRGLWVSGAYDSNYAYSASYSRSQIGKPYNYNFFNITTTSSFYCSQLVWRSWYNQGWDLNDGGAVWPVDLLESPYTIVFYSQG
jgi:uncharacterized protein YycO